MEDTVADKRTLLGDQPTFNYGSLPALKPKVCMEISGYRKVKWRIVLCFALCVLTLGILLVIFHWKPRLYVLLICKNCPLAEANWVIIKDVFGQISIAEVKTEHGVDPGLDQGPRDRLDAVENGSVAIAVAEEDDFKDTIRLHHKEESDVLRYFIHEGMRYIWSDRSMDFVTVSSLTDGLTCGDLHRFKSGLSIADHNSRKQLYGPNEINVQVKSYGILLIDEVLNPFYIFQIFSVILWFFENYFYYAGCIIVIAVVSICISLYETRKQSVTLHNMVKVMVSLKVRRANGEEVFLSSEDLVPGDCIILPVAGVMLPCDAVLLSGECMVNESLLTGESVPEMKTPLPDSVSTANTLYSSDEHRRHTIFCGTQVIQAKSYVERDVLAVVTKTGFSTIKGNLISSILHPKPIKFKFYRDAFLFVLVLAVFAFFGTIYSLVMLIRNKLPVYQLVIRVLDVITIVVPPALPAAMTVGTIYAQGRLKKKGIFCISPPRINVCGKVKMVCFDKTGTLTEEGLDVWGVIPLDNVNFLPIVHEPRYLLDGPLLYALAACHSVTLLNGSPIGDLMDVKMMDSTGWTLEDSETEEQLISIFGTKILTMIKPPPGEEQPHGPKHQVPVGVLQRFPFSSSLQRMSVITKLPGSLHCDLYLKGAPEMVASLCRNETVPPDFSAMLRQYTQDGYRVLAFGYKTLPSINSFEDAQAMARESAERELTFLGFLVMKNVLKPETAPVIYELRKAEIRTVMVTGDNMLTAVNVAKSCHMVESTEKVYFVNVSPPLYSSAATLKFIPSELSPGEDPREGLYQQGGTFLNKEPFCFAINGKSFAALTDYFPDLLPKILINATIFARMSPDQKTQLVRNFQELNYCVGMCGDGANDCGALKAADVGISLSDAEASVASPFTSKLSNIECVPAVIREGRCSLETSFGVFKYMALYSLTQFITVLVLYTVSTNLGDFQFLFIDLVIATSVAILMGRTGPADELGIKRPLGTLISIPVLGSLILQILLIWIAILLSVFITQSQTWFVPINATSTAPQHLPNYEDTTLFCLSIFQYLILAVILSKGYPFRKPLYTNILFLLLLFVLLALAFWINLYPLNFMIYLLQLKNIPDFNFKFVIIGLAAVNFIAAFLVETALDHGCLNCLRRLRKKKESKKLYKRLEKYLRGQHSWPPLNQTLYPSSSHAALKR
ncbi:cation-transporting ATPase 13A2 isoform X2 [Pelobates cultripes]|uniref:Cation-transporting ATPase 13A2 isoform X2 n=2 Tax=Pelobates cultripes TaxID=61616 RepID=A0AAD1T3L5_PELCU|nr:cation-transporting ATPase 13A2 isoform X2 [Pelobates cultripes]